MPILAPALSLEQVSVSYGSLRAVTDVSFEAMPERTVALVGPNGAGKSSLLRAICNQATKTAGCVRLKGVDISSLPTYRITRRGVSLVPEGRQMIGPLTVQENLELAAQASHRRHPRERVTAVHSVYDLFPPLQGLRKRPTTLLSGGEQQMVAIGRALVSRPDVLLLDEPSMGLAPVMVETIYSFLEQNREELGGAAVVIAEQNRSALALAQDVVVLSRGRVVHRGPVELLAEDILTSAYLGSSTAEESPIPAQSGIVSEGESE